MDRGPDHGAGDRIASGLGLRGSSGRRGCRAVGRRHPARRGRLRHDRRPHVLHVRIGVGDRAGPARFARGRVAVLIRPARERPDPRHAGEHRLGAVRGDRPRRRGRPLPRRGEPHGHLGLLDERGGGHRWRHARIGSRSTGLLGRLRDRPRRPDPDVGSRQRVVDGGRDERRRATRGRCGSGPGSRVSGSAGDRHRRAGDRRALAGRRRLPDRGCDPEEPGRPARTV